MPCREISPVFLPGNSKKFHFKWKILPIDDLNQGIFLQTRALFSNFWKRAGETFPSTPLVMRLNLKLPRKFFAEALQTWISKTVHTDHRFGGFLLLVLVNLMTAYLYHTGNKKNHPGFARYMDWVEELGPLSFTQCVLYFVKSWEITLCELFNNRVNRVSKNILIERRYSFIHQKGVVFWGNLWRESFK